MHGMLVGAVIGMAVVAFVGAWRSIDHWRSSKRRPAIWVLAVQVAGQVLIGLVALAFGVWFLLFGE